MNPLHPLYFTLVVGNREFSRTFHLSDLPRKGSTIIQAGFKFKVIAENHDFDIYDSDQKNKTEKAFEGIIAIPRNLPENANIAKIWDALRSYYPEDRMRKWEEFEISFENERLVKALQNKKKKPNFSDWCCLILAIGLLLYTLFELVFRANWPMLIGTLFSLLVLISAFSSEDSPFRKK
ncbi:MAG TPA: hypothetical protein VL576_03090 [Candidatus Paceibacterota bacterium]|jgi:hypothetical protein|nr:hypothetical protein [Candidatus Paceibacterota bacterium]